MKKIKVLALLAATAMFMSCVSTGGSDNDPAVNKGVNAWNSKGPAAAEAYWVEIKDAEKQKKYLNYIKLFNAGNNALESTDTVKASNEAKLLSACNTALTKFEAIDASLKLPADVAEKGGTLTAARIDKLIGAGKIADATKMYKRANKVYAGNASLAAISSQVKAANTINSKVVSLFEQADKAGQIEDFDAKIAAYDAVLAKCPALESEANALVKSTGAASNSGLAVYAKSVKKVRQDISVQHEAAFREKIYDFKDRIGAEFARQPEGPGSGKNGSYTLDEIHDHYVSVSNNMDKIYNELLAFAAKYNKNVSQEVIDDVKAQKNDLNAKIAQVNREIANKKEIESRGKTVMPLMIGLFNPAPGSTKESQKSRPAKFSAKGQKGSEYWWGMVSIPKGQMNDLVITLKDNRTVRVFNENTKSGKLIEKNNIQDLVSRSSRVGNSWPVLNAGSQLKGSNYFFEIQKGKTDSYSGEVVVYSSFIVRMR